MRKSRIRSRGFCSRRVIPRLRSDYRLPGTSVRSRECAAVHLRSIKIRGFKSFPDPLEIELEPGVAVVVGPNGSGKSNIADAVVWAAGSLTPSELRAEKPDDVLFAGGGRSEGRRALRGRARVRQRGRQLAGARLQRGLDRAHGSSVAARASTSSTRRRCAAPTSSSSSPTSGSESAMHSIVGQGKVEQVLASKPEDRRAFVEEAAGLGKFKRRRHRAELKLARVALQVERARDVEEEVRKRLRPLALQATAAERAEKLVVEIASLHARVAELDVADAGERRSEVEVRRDAAALARRGAQSRLEGLLADRTRAEDELSDAAGRREAAVAALYRLQGGSERLELRNESAVRSETGSRRELGALEPRRPARRTAGGSSSARLSSRLVCRATRRSRAGRSRRAGTARGRAASLARARSRGAGGTSAGRARACRTGRASGARRARVEPGSERAVAAALRARASAVLADDPRAGARAARASSHGGPRQPHRSRRARCRKSSSREFPVVPEGGAARASRCRRSRRRGSATTRRDASCGSRARRPRRYCSSSRRGVARSGRRRGARAAGARGGARGRRDRDAGGGFGCGSRRAAAYGRWHDDRSRAARRGSTSARTSARERARSRSGGGRAVRRAAPRARRRGSAEIRRARGRAPPPRSRGGRPSAGARGGDGAGDRRPRSSSRGSTPRPRRRVEGWRLRRPSLQKATIATSSPLGPSGSRLGARRSGR